eukprot:CAMPEP_0184262558 /NCGR_PEP_ID=MMETSP0977-20130417/15944_1 /TAXON_ID=483370 /ORGANISM="non described non described, Strain CCMP2097" /LENGTH=32 /DNA_ID= /DNA_START= /DNA_END= /DNA_ORIENTATION=
MSCFDHVVKRRPPHALHLGDDAVSAAAKKADD